MTTEQILKKAKYIKEHYNADDPFVLAKELGANVLFENLGSSPTAIKGFYAVSKGIKGIMINSNLSDKGKRIICYHEIGHHVCTSGAPFNAFQDFRAFENSVAENEANLFAAEIMIDDNDVLSRLNEDYTIYTMAMELCVPVEMLAMKFKALKFKGYEINNISDTLKSNFLKNFNMNYMDGVWW